LLPGQRAEKARGRIEEAVGTDVGNEANSGNVVGDRIDTLLSGEGVDECASSSLRTVPRLLIVDSAAGHLW
jgi:hypothetical protein